MNIDNKDLARPIAGIIHYAIGKTATAHDNEIKDAITAELKAIENEPVSEELLIEDAFDLLDQIAEATGNGKFIRAVNVLEAIWSNFGGLLNIFPLRRKKRRERKK